MKINDAYAPGLYVANEGRYNDMKYRRCGRSGILLPALSMGLWHNLGHTDDLENGRNILRACFDYGITHFDLAGLVERAAGRAEPLQQGVGHLALVRGRLGQGLF